MDFYFLEPNHHPVLLGTTDLYFRIKARWFNILMATAHPPFWLLVSCPLDSIEIQKFQQLDDAALGSNKLKRKLTFQL